MMRTTINSEITKGIVLKTMPYKENDQLVTLYTYEFGKLTIRARGSRKLTSKNAPALMSITEGEYEIALKSGLSNLIRATAIQYYQNIKKTIEAEIVADYLLEYFYRYESENSPSLEHYQFLEGILEALEIGYDYRIIYAYINCFIMKENGVELMTDGCVVCGNHHVDGFSIENGGFVCHEHYHLHDLRLPKDQLQAIRYLYKCPISRLHELHLEDIKPIQKIFEYYVDEFCGVNLRSRKFVKSIL